MVKGLIVFALSFTIAFPMMACEKNVYRLLKDEAAPCEGFLFSPEKELELRLLDTEHDFLLKELEVKDRLINLYKDEGLASSEIISIERHKTELWRSVAEENTLALIKVQENKGYRDWLFFVGGILCTVAAGYSLGQASK